jgi:hypothetical protein
MEVSRSTDEHISRTVTFSPGARYSSPFRIVRAWLDDCDHLALSVDIRTDFSKVVGFCFFWEFSNPSGADSARDYLVTFSVLPAYFTLFFASQVRFDSDAPLQLFLLILGIAGVFAANPLATCFSSPAFVRMTDHFCMSFFVALFRAFLLAQLDRLRNPTAPVSSVTLAVLALLCSACGVIDGAAGYDRAMHWSLPRALSCRVKGSSSSATFSILRVGLLN